MTVADGSLVRLAFVAESAVGTIPTSPVFQIARYENADLRISKQTDIPNEVDSSGNVRSITDVGRSVTGSISGLLSYGTYDKFLESLLRKAWATNVLVNGTSPITLTIEEFYEQGTTDTYIRYRGMRVNTLDLTMDARKSVQANFGFMGIDSPTPTTAILSGATYTAATTTEVFNAGLNLSGLTITGITNSPIMMKLSLKINSNVYQNDAVGQYAPYGHGLGRSEVTGSFTAYFENLDTYQAILDHTTVGMSWTLEDAAGNSYLFELPKVKLLDGGPAKPGNGQAVMIDVPFQAFYDASTTGSIKITRTAA